MRKLREILRLKYETRLPHRAIARACGVGAGTVSVYLVRARAAGLSWPLTEELDDAQLEAKVFGGPLPSKHPRPLPDLVRMHQERKRAGVTLQLLWLEYLHAHPHGYRYSQFCQIYRRWRKRLHPTMRQRHRAGEKVFVDYSGKKLELVDRHTGERRPVELFVGVLGASSLIYAQASTDQSLASWVDCHRHMLEYLGGVPKVFVPDQLRSAVAAPCRYEPEVNRTYQALARHYGAVVIPARARKPKDKAKAEAAVLMAQRWILAVLRDRHYLTLRELNAAIRNQLDRINHRPMKRLGKSRWELFAELDRPALKPLPTERFEMAQWKFCRVHVDYHVEVERNYYSVPYTLLHELLEARFTASVVELYHRGRRVASHPRVSGQGHYSTCPPHRPPAHRAQAEWSPSRLIAWAEKTGPTTARLVTEILHRRRHPEQGYRACLGLMRLGRHHGPERLEAACARAERFLAYSYRAVKNILTAGLDRLPLDELDTPTAPRPVHENIRGATYYTFEEQPRC